MILFFSTYQGTNMRLVQLRDESGARRVAISSDEGDRLRLLEACDTLYDLCRLAMNDGVSLESAATSRVGAETASYATALEDRRILVPIDHPDPVHLHVTGTGLTHLGSADTRDQMHKEAPESEDLTDSMKMFRMGLEAGKPVGRETGVQPEWFYKGNGTSLVGPEADLALPSFASDGGEEPEVAGIYVIDGSGVPYRVGFALGNEYADHVMERVNYLWLAPSKIRSSSCGPEILLGELPAHVAGTSRIHRKGEAMWEKPFVSGEDNMSHSIRNLEYHHFKYPIFRQPGDVHVHYFGTATLSFADQIKPEDGDVFEITCETFGRPLRNRVRASAEERVDVRRL